MLVTQADAFSQWTGEVEVYKYAGNGPVGSFQSLAHIQSPGKWYAEIRHNYEDAKTFSFYAGKTFSGGKHAKYSITTMIGYSAGVFTGSSLALNADLEWKGFYYSSQSQYSISSKMKEDNFLFSWSELGYSLSDHFFSGVSLQYTRMNRRDNVEPGLVTGLSFGYFEIPFYVFKPFHPDRYFVLGLSYQFNIGKKTKGLSLVKE